MKKKMCVILASTLAFALAIVPAQAKESPEVETLRGYLQVDYETLGREKWVSPGTLVASMEEELQDGETLQCTWFSHSFDDQYEEVDVQDTGISCLEPYETQISDAGRRIYAQGEFIFDGQVTALYETDRTPLVKASGPEIEFGASVQKPLVYMENASISLDVTANPGNVELRNPAWTASIVNAKGSIIESLNRGYSVYVPETHTYKVLNSVDAPVLVKLTVYSDNFVPITQTANLGTVKPGQLTGVVAPEISRVGDWIQLSKAARTDQTDKVAEFYLEIDGKKVDVKDATMVAVEHEMSGQKVQLFARFDHWNYHQISVPSNIITLPKVTTAFELEKQEFTGKAQVLQTISAPKVKVYTANATVRYQWYAFGNAIPGATGESFVIPVDFNDVVVSVTISVSAPNYLTSGSNVGGPQISLQKATAISGPVIKGNSVVGSTLRYVDAVWSGGQKTTDIAWLVDGKSFDGGTGKALKVTASMLGKQISLKTRTQSESHRPVTAYAPSVTVKKSTASVKASLSSKSIKRSKSVNLKVKVVSPGTTKPVGTVKVTVGKKTFKATVKASHKGKVSIKLKGLAVGKNQAVKVKFTPSSKSTGKFSKSSKTTTVAKITVKK